MSQILPQKNFKIIGSLLFAQLKNEKVGSQLANSVTADLLRPTRSSLGGTAKKLRKNGDTNKYFFRM